MIRPVYNWFNRNWFIIATWLVIANILAVVLFLAGCGEARSLDPNPSPAPWWTTLATLGATLTWAGGISAAAGIALRVLGLFYLPLAPLAGLGTLAATGGAAVLVTGAACQWLADNPLVVLLVGAGCVGAVMWWHWPDIRRAISNRLERDK
jgi:hypothetical protein